MKEYLNENGTSFTYDENETQTVKDKKTGNVVIFTFDEIINFVLNTKIWDGYHRPFNVLNIRNWIQFLKMADNISPNNVISLRNNNNQFKSDYEIACDIRQMIDNKEDKNGTKFSKFTDSQIYGYQQSKSVIPHS